MDIKSASVLASPDLNPIYSESFMMHAFLSPTGNTTDMSVNGSDHGG
jgi:hypothetical protein